MNKPSRKSFLYGLTLALMLIVFDATGLSVALAQTTGPEPASARVKLPSGSANPDLVFFSDYGQFVANPLLRFWRVNGRFNSFGGPMSQAITNRQNHIVQYFQKVALGYQPELAGTGWEIRPYHIGRLWLEAQPPEVREAAPFGGLPPLPQTANRRYFPETRHTLSAGFLDLYNKTGQLFIWGFPLSEEYQLTRPDGTGYTAQLFERGRMLWSPATGAMIDPNFGTEMAMQQEAPTVPQANPEPQPGQAKIPEYSTWAWEHWADVSLSNFTVTFYEGDLPVRTNLTVSGTRKDPTPVGTFYINRRIYNEHMRGGEIGTEDYYDLQNVLFTQYFTWEGHALHLAWWRSSFGYAGSHGCVNMDYVSAEFAWNWMTLGGRVTIHY